MSKLFSLHGGSLLKPPLHSAQGRHPHKGMENDGLEMYFKTAVRIKLCNGRTKLPTPATVFSFPVYRGRIVSIIKFSLVLVRLPLSAAISCSVKKAMALIDFFGNLAAYISQMEKVIFVHCEKAAVPQGSHCMAHAWL